MTDWQQPFVMLLTQAKGVSIVHETIFEDRFGYTRIIKERWVLIYNCTQTVWEVKNVVINIKTICILALFSGPTPLKSADICIPDLRAGFSYLLAALMADGESHITGIDHIERGYEKILDKMKSLGADIEVTAE